MTRQHQDPLAGAGPSASRRPLPPARARAAARLDSIPVQTRDPDPPPTSDGDTRPTGFPSVIPILPLRGLVGYPHTPIPLTIGQPRSIKPDRRCRGGDRLIGLVASHQPEIELPGPDRALPLRHHRRHPAPVPCTRRDDSSDAAGPGALRAGRLHDGASPTSRPRSPFGRRRSKKGSRSRPRCGRSRISSSRSASSPRPCRASSWPAC